MTAAIFGLIGVIVGGVLTGAVEAFRDRWAQRTLSRAAARLLSAELSVQQEILQRRAGDGSAEPANGEMPGVADWPEQRVVMAKTLDDKTWIAVAGAYGNLVVWHAQDGRSPATADDRRDEMAALALQLQDARDSLRAFRSQTEPAAAGR